MDATTGAAGAPAQRPTAIQTRPHDVAIAGAHLPPRHAVNRAMSPAPISVIVPGTPGACVHASMPMSASQAARFAAVATVTQPRYSPITPSMRTPSATVRRPGNRQTRTNVTSSTPSRITMITNDSAMRQASTQTIQTALSRADAATP